MEKMVIVKYHGIKMGAKMLDVYSNGAQINVKIGEYTDPIPLEVALKLKEDFGADTFEIMAEAELPTTKEEAETIEAAMESGDAIKVADNLLPLHIDKAEAEAQIEETQEMPDGIKVTRKARTDKREAFDKTEVPVKYTKKVLNRMKKAKLIALFKAMSFGKSGIKPKISPTDSKAIIVNKILTLQG